MQIFSHVALSPHVSCYFRLCAGHYSHKIIHRNNSYAVIYLQTRGLFPSAGRPRALAICDHLPAFRGRARLRPSCSGSFLHPSRTPVSFQPTRATLTAPHSRVCPWTPTHSSVGRGGALRIAAQPLGRPLWDERTPPGEKQL